ncbi:MAG: secondary thiamine-phosphate synthase enzyme YjbQ [Planctomycetota bacterium]
MLQELTVATRGRGLHDITAPLRDLVRAAAAAAGGADGLCSVFVRHTSCSLLVQENADPSAARDLERWLDRAVPDGEPFYTHTAEGPDDMPSHVKAMLLPVSLSLPVRAGDLWLGTWQGVYLFEHRRRGTRRSCAVHVAC